MIYKRIIPAHGKISIPDCEKVLSVGVDTQGERCLWYIHNPGCRPCELNILFTGEEVDERYMIHLGTAKHGSLISHVFGRY